MKARHHGTNKLNVEKRNNIDELRQSFFVSGAPGHDMAGQGKAKKRTEQQEGVRANH